MKKKICLLIASILCVSMLAGCEVITNNNIGKSSLEYNTDYIQEKVDEVNASEAEEIAKALDDLGMGKIITKTSKIINGEGAYTFGDMKNKYKLIISDGKISHLTDSEGEIVYDFTGDSDAGKKDKVKEDKELDKPDVEDDEEFKTPEVEDVDEDTEADDHGIGELSGNTDKTTGETYLDSKVENALKSLDTDYNKINWGVRYSPFEELPGIVFSVTPFIDNSYSKPQYNLIVAITNLYDEDVTISAEGDAKCENGEKAHVNIFDTAIGSGITTIHKIYCESMPTGAISWAEIKTQQVFQESATWEANWEIRRDENSYAQLSYIAYGNAKMQMGYVWALVLDDNGYVIGYGQDYNADKIPAGTNATGNINFNCKDFGVLLSDVAIFANPEKVKN